MSSSWWTNNLMMVVGRGCHRGIALGPGNTSGESKTAGMISTSSPIGRLLRRHGRIPSVSEKSVWQQLCVKASHYWAKPSERWKPKPRKAIRGRIKQLPDSEIRRIRLLDSFGSDEDEIGQRFGLTKRQVAQHRHGQGAPRSWRKASLVQTPRHPSLPRLIRAGAAVAVDATSRAGGSAFPG